MDTLKGIQEHVESEFGESIVSRDDALVILGSVPGLGPPDLCWLQKTSSTPFSSTAESKGYYHWTLGRDVSSSAAVAAYFASLNSAVEAPGLLQGLFTYTEHKIERGFYCCYDPFSRLDIRCELTVPGGVVVGAVDCTGALHEVTLELWKTAHVAAFLRAELYGPELLAAGQGVFRYDLLPDQAAEDRLLATVEELYSAGVLPSALDNLSADLGRGCTAEHMDLVCFTIHHYFSRRHRWKRGLKFFSRLYEVYAPAAVYVAACQREMEELDAAFSTLSDALDVDPTNCHLLTAMATELLFVDQVEAATKLVRQSLRQNSSYRPSWLILARCYVKSQQPQLALVVLNIVPTPPVPREEWETLQVVPCPASQRLTSPGATMYDPEVEQHKQILADEASLDGKGVLKVLYGAVMCNREPLDLGPTADVAPIRATRAVLGSVYAILQEMVAVAGWDQFLDIRSQVFLMHASPSKAAEAAASPARSDTSKAASRQAATAAGDDVDKMLGELADMGLKGQPGHGRDTQSPLDAPPERRPPPIRTSVKQPPSSPQPTLAAQPGPAHPPDHPPPQQQQARSSTSGFKRPDSMTAGISSVMEASQMLEASGATGGISGNPQLWQTVFGARTAKPIAEGRNSDSGSSESPSPSRSHSASASTPTAATSFLSDPEIQDTIAALHSTLGNDLLLHMAATPPPHPPRPQPHTPARPSPTSDPTLPLLAPHLATSTTPAASPASPPNPAPTSSPILPTVCQMSTPGWQDPPIHADQSSLRDQAATFADPSSPAFQTSCFSIKPRTPAPGCFPAASSRPTAYTDINIASRQLPPHLGAPQHPSKAPGRVAGALVALLRRAAGEPRVIGSMEKLPGSYSIDNVLADGSGMELSGGAPYGRPGPVAEGTAANLDHQGSAASASTLQSQPSLGSDSLQPIFQGPARHSSPAARQLSPNRNQLGRTSSAAAEYLKVLEVDMERAIAGLAPGEMGKRLCVRWLDELILALWHDLQAFNDWKAADEKLLAATGQTHAGLLLGLPKVGGDTPASPSGVQLPARTSGDWLRRGALAERLYHDQDAALAYRCALKHGPLPAALLSLLRIYSDQGAVADALLVAMQLLAWHDSRRPFPQHGRVPAATLMAVRQLAETMGRDTLTKELAALSKAHPAFQAMVVDFEHWPE